MVCELPLTILVHRAVFNFCHWILVVALLLRDNVRFFNIVKDNFYKIFTYV